MARRRRDRPGIDALRRDLSALADAHELAALAESLADLREQAELPAEPLWDRIARALNTLEGPPETSEPEGDDEG